MAGKRKMEERKKMSFVEILQARVLQVGWIAVDLKAPSTIGLDRMIFFPAAAQVTALPFMKLGPKELHSQ